MKRTCYRCRATDGERCELGYRVKIDTLWSGGMPYSDDPKPVEECPKPRTYRELLALPKKSQCRPTGRAHSFHRCSDIGCNICRGGLSYCVVCEEGEAGLTESCSGPPDKDSS